MLEGNLTRESEAKHRDLQSNENSQNSQNEHFANVLKNCQKTIIHRSYRDVLKNKNECKTFQSSYNFECSYSITDVAHSKAQIAHSKARIAHSNAHIRHLTTGIAHLKAHKA